MFHSLSNFLTLTDIWVTPALQQQMTHFIVSLFVSHHDVFLPACKAKLPPPWILNIIIVIKDDCCHFWDTLKVLNCC